MASQFVSKSRRLLGVRRQQWIRGFFGTSALISSVVIFLISIFLVWEAVRFFPAHRAELRLARRSGQEYVDYLIRETAWSQQVLGIFRQLYYRERDHRFAVETGLIEGFELFEEWIEELAEEEIEAWEVALASGDDDVRRAKERYLAKVREIAREVRWAEVDPFGRLENNRTAREALIESVLEYDPLLGDRPALVIKASQHREQGLAVLENAKRVAELSVKPLERLRDRLAGEALTIRRETEGRDDFDFAGCIEVIVEARGEHVRAVRRLQEGLGEAVAALPVEVAAPAGRALLVESQEAGRKLNERLQESLEASSVWDWREEVGWGESAAAFFFGTEWRVGSGWRQVFGLLPLITGTLLVSLIAMAVAVPFALGAAVYVNQLATRREQTLIKPAIEMVQAIPSVVLGFFGVVVLGDLLMEVSASSWLSWLPGFPVTERLNVLNAGLLLALMAVPTVFTLCEDALQRVPRSLSEASLALGASRVHTVSRVVIPVAFSGIVAGVLLGFGRVIGETMVVLLVAGNRIAMPDWGAGLGILTQPGHTMTGIIADEMGPVTTGTLHYRALFLLGLILFVISLVVHLMAQRLVKRYLRHA